MLSNLLSNSRLLMLKVPSSRPSSLCFSLVRIPLPWLKDRVENVIRLPRIEHLLTSQWDKVKKRLLKIAL